jgi:hypothetical protein
MLKAIWPTSHKRRRPFLHALDFVLPDSLGQCEFDMLVLAFTGMAGDRC